MFLFTCTDKKGITMSNPFLIGASDAYAQTAAISNSYIGSGSQQGANWGAYGTGSEGVSSPSIFPASGTGGTSGVTSTGASYQSDLNEVSQIGLEKRQGFENGLGGTNSRDNHLLWEVA